MTHRSDNRNSARLVLVAVTAATALLAQLPVIPGLAGAAPSATRAGQSKVVVASRTTRMTRVNHGERRTVLCPGGKSPYGGGLIGKPLPGFDGEGVYPHSYERLGVQGGYHISPVLFDPSPQQTTQRKVTLQVVCGPKLGHVTPPHVTTKLSPGQTKQLIATCPGRRHLIGGGFQRTDFNNRGGVVATESRAISSKKWRVSGHAYGGFGGEMTAIAYCVRSRKPLLQTVAKSTTIDRHAFGSARTRGCPKGRYLVFGGFNTPLKGSVFQTNGSVKPNNAWATSGFNRGATAKLTAYGYCLKL